MSGVSSGWFWEEEGRCIPRASSGDMWDFWEWGALCSVPADGWDPLKAVLGTVSHWCQNKRCPGFLSADRSPASVEMHDPVPTHVASEESRYILETGAGTKVKHLGDCRVGGVFMQVSEMSKHHS